MSDPNSYRAAASAGPVTDDDAIRIGAFLRRTYGWMCAGLVVTGVVAGVVASTPALYTLLQNSLALIVAVFAQLGLVVWISRRISAMSPGRAATIFLSYAALTGFVFGGIVMAYSANSLGSTFLVTAGMFGALAFYGTITRRNLTGLGQFAFMGLIGLILAMVVSFFWQSDALQFLLMVVGIIVFSCLTAYKAQMLKGMALAVEGEQAEAYAVYGGLTLYISFVNLFLTLLRIFGRRR